MCAVQNVESYIKIRVLASSVTFLKKLRIKNLAAIKQVKYQNCVTLRTYPIVFL
jgi:hypothetical protein